MGMSVRQHGIWTSPWSHFKKNSKALFKCMAPPSLPFPFFPTAQENMIRVHWCVYNEEVTVSWERSCNSPYRGTGFLGELAEHSCSLMHALMCASDDPSKSKVLLRHRLHKTHTVRLYQYPLLSAWFFQPKTRNETKMNDVWIEKINALPGTAWSRIKKDKNGCIYNNAIFKKKCYLK